MIDIQQILECDKNILLALNGSDSLFWDGFMWVYTGIITWIPLAIILLYIIIKNNKLKEVLLIVGMLALVIFLADRISSGFFKPYFHRFRPTQDPNIMYLVDIVNSYRGGRYGFLSGHAANSFGILTFFALLIKKKEFTYAMLFWAILNCYSRIYLGVHYLGDILCGTLLGCLIGYLVYFIYKFIYKRMFPSKYSSITNKYSNPKYLGTDMKPILTVLYSNYFFIIIIGFIISTCKFI